MKEVRNTKYYAKMTAIVLCWLALWEIADRVINNRIVLSGPIHIIGALGEQIRQPDFWVTCGASFARITVGFFAVVCCRIFAGGTVLPFHAAARHYHTGDGDAENRSDDLVRYYAAHL